MLGQKKTLLPRTTRGKRFLAVMVLSAGFCLAGRQELAFEVASIRPAAPLPEPERTLREELWDNSWLGHYPGTHGRVRLEHIRLRQLIAITYSVRAQQVIGKKELAAGPFNIEARLTEGADVNRVDEMLKNLLKERFSLKAHMEDRNETGRQLVVRAGGVHLKAADPTMKGKGGAWQVCFRPKGKRCRRAQAPCGWSTPPWGRWPTNFRCTSRCTLRTSQDCRVIMKYL